MNVEQARFNMIEQQIRPWDVLDGEVLDLMATVKREAFAPAAHRALAFADLEIPLKPGDQAVADGQVMLAPRVEARMLQDLGVAKHETVLEIGTGSGYMAALLSQLAQRVLTIEIDADLAEIARTNLENADCHNVTVRTADAASTSFTADGPFDVVVLTGSVAQLPHALLDIIKPGGRLLAVVGDEPIMRATLVKKAGHGLVTTQPWDTIIPRLRNFPEPSHFEF